jgi:hypothetical protein
MIRKLFSANPARIGRFDGPLHLKEINPMDVETWSQAREKAFPRTI